MVLLVTSDNEQFVVDKDVAERSVLIKNMLEGKFHQAEDAILAFRAALLTTRLSLRRCWRERSSDTSTKCLF